MATRIGRAVAPQKRIDVPANMLRLLVMEVTQRSCQRTEHEQQQHLTMPVMWIIQAIDLLHQKYAGRTLTMLQLQQVTATMTVMMLGHVHTGQEEDESAQELSNTTLKGRMNAKVPSNYEEEQVQLKSTDHPCKNAN
jgi:hypothetical protein